MDSIKVHSDFTPIINQLDSNRIQSEINFKKLSQIIETGKKEDNLFQGVSNDAIFSTATTILVFSLGVIINIIRKKIEKLQSNRRIRNFVKQHLDRIVNSYSIKLQESYSELANKTTIDTGIKLTPPKLLSNDFQRILHLNSGDLYNSIKKKKELSNVLSQIDFISNMLPEIQAYHSKALSRSNELRDSMTLKINQYMDSLAKLTYHEKYNTPDYEKREPYLTINNSINKFYKEISGKREIQKFYDEILRPNQEFLIRSKIFESHAVGKEIAEKGKDLTHLINELKDLTQEFKSQYTDFSISIKNSSSSLKENMDKINWR